MFNRLEQLSQAMAETQLAITIDPRQRVGKEICNIAPEVLARVDGQTYAHFGKLINWQGLPGDDEVLPENIVPMPVIPALANLAYRVTERCPDAISLQELSDPGLSWKNFFESSLRWGRLGLLLRTPEGHDFGFERDSLGLRNAIMLLDPYAGEQDISRVFGGQHPELTQYDLLSMFSDLELQPEFVTDDWGGQMSRERIAANLRGFLDNPQVSTSDRGYQGTRANSLIDSVFQASRYMTLSDGLVSDTSNLL